LNRKEKELFISGMKDRLQRAQATFLIDYQGLNVDSMNRIRRELRKGGTELHVIKNRLISLASAGTDSASIQDHFIGPCALAVTYDNIAAPAKVLIELSKEFKNLDIKVGQMAGKPIDLDAIKRLAELPGRDILLSQLLSTMQAVPSSLVRVLNGATINLLNILKAIGNEKTEAGA